MYAREFGWTPAQVDELPLKVERMIGPICKVISEDNERIDAARTEAARRRAEKEEKLGGRR